ncbi:MAG TPA: patatin-like phospholipase family protein [Steroidobacteraceae bacterium]|nr:patatin-like phospholipase family protein [Steroidobacteraceae bacterium]
MNERASAGPRKPRIALVLPGGGARAAYQVGVLQAIAGWCPPAAPLPFDVLCGTSAGAINAAVIASRADHVQRAAADLAGVWSQFHVEQVFRTGTLDMIRSGLHLLFALVSGGFLLPMPRALFNNLPLRALLQRSVDFEALARAVEAGRPDAVAVMATSVTSGDSVAFVQSSRAFRPWDRAGRKGVAATLALEHLMASSAIPLLFPTVAMDGQHFGDGAMRQATPLAPALHLGADRILVIGSRQPERHAAAEASEPNLADHFGFMLDSLFMEGLQSDLERLARVNSLIAQFPPGGAPFGLRHVETLLMVPQRDPAEIALAHRMAIPGTLRAFLRVLGATGVRGGRLLSFLMFESRYTRELMRLGERDAEARRAEIVAFLDLP